MALPLPDAEQASWMSKAAAAVVTFLTICWGVLRTINRKDADVVKGHGESIKEIFKNQREDKTQLQEMIETKAEALSSSIAKLADTQRLDRDAILTAIREDRHDTHAALGAIKDGFSKFSQDMVYELGQRPTRDELPHGVLYQGTRKEGAG